jgi:hypothetical protein
MRVFLLAFSMLFALNSWSQGNTDSDVTCPGAGKKLLGLELCNFTFGVGINAIDNTALTSENSLFDINKNWNILPFISAISADYGWNSRFTSGSVLSFNRLNETILQNDKEITDNKIYVALDVNTRWYPIKSKSFDAFVTGVVGTLVADGKPGVTAGFGLGAQGWFSKHYGMRVEAMGKVHPLHDVMGKSHAQYILSAMYRLE